MTNTYDFLVLGASGQQGRIVVRDMLENGFSVFLADLDQTGSQRFLGDGWKATFEHIDLRDTGAIVTLIKKVAPAVVVNCAEGDWNLNVYNACLETKNHVIDLGSDIEMTKQQLALGTEFKTLGLTAMSGCGSTPGINNITLAYARSRLDTINDISAGFAWDSNIKKFVVPFSIQSIIEEFTAPAPIIENSEWKMKMPLENVETRHFREIGEQECFLVVHPETYTFFLYYQKDGLRNMRFYAGFPKHSAEVIRMFIDTGFGEKKSVMVDGKEVRPIDVLTETLRRLPTPDGYIEKENLWVEAVGVKDGASQKILMETIVPTLPGWEDAGCNIDTGMTVSIFAQMIKDGRISERGSFVPGPIVPTDEFFKELRKRQMLVFENGLQVN